MRPNLATLIDDLRRADRDIAVVRYQGNRRRVTTYGQLASLASRFATLLAQRGIGPGDRVLIWGESSAEWIAVFLGCVLRGVLAVPLDAAGTAIFAARVAADVQPRLAVGDLVLLSQLPADSLPPADARIAFEDLLSVLPAEESGPVPDLKAETPLEILFTSGTTGDPKGIVLTHGNVLASFGPIEQSSQPYLRYVRIIHPFRILLTLPLSHVFGQMLGLWVPIIYRAELHLESRPAAPRLAETIRRERISVLAAVPRVVALLKTHLESNIPGLAELAAGLKGTGTGVPIALRWWRFRKVHGAFGLKFWAIVCGGGALLPAVEKFWHAVGLVLVQGYGMTESTAMITLNHPFHVAEGTIGKPVEGREVKLGPDGEVLVRGAAISSATWSGGELHPRTDEWLATGDLAKLDADGDLLFLGRKSEVIVTANGLNIHPEDLEAAIELEPGVNACAVVPVQAAAGPEPCAVLAMRGSGDQAAAAIEHANAKLAEFQRLHRWVLWPEPDLPRTSSGKVRRKAVSEWLDHLQAASTGNHTNGTAAFGASSDWLLTLIAQISGETPPGVGDDLSLSDDLHLDSLGRVQLAAAIEDRLGITAEYGVLDQVQTLGDLRHLLAANTEAPAPASPPSAKAAGKTPSARELPSNSQAEPAPGGSLESSAEPTGEPSAAHSTPDPTPQTPSPAVPAAPPPRATYLYPHWPWWAPVRAFRSAFMEAVIIPFIAFLMKPAVLRDSDSSLDPKQPMLIVANHVTEWDGPLLAYSLPGPIRRRLTVAMAGEMLEDYRHFRNPNVGPRYHRFAILGPLNYFFATLLFNVFPLPRVRDFQRSFAHAGDALDHGFNVLLFPEGELSKQGKLARFRSGIGLLVKESSVPVLPIALRGLGEMKTKQTGWFRSGKFSIRVGKPIRFSPLDSESTITARLQAEVEKLMERG
jgi:long-chain acyl-CoA synthetase